MLGCELVAGGIGGRGAHAVTGLLAYTDLTLGYWEIPAEDAALVAQLHRDYGPRPGFGVRYLAC